ncbi:hypothetical protein BGW39_001616 [Mortierella sp. 14UC]|nr:hypothetical protein BGW39_001616 [Mortierella sp. 14UC]
MGLQKMSLVYAYRDLSVPYNTAINFTDIRDDGDIEQEDEEVVDDYKDEAPLPAMKELRVTGMGTNDPHPPTWSRFFKRCEHLRALHVSSIDQSWVQALAECRTVERLTLVVADIEILRLLTTALRTGLPSLNELCIEDLHASDEALASVLSVCRAGWRSIELPTINSCSVDALIEHHCPTLEVIKVLTVPEISSTQMVQILASSPRLHTFVMFDEEFIFDPKEPHFEADDFIDLDHSTGQLRPWLCESTLKEFRAHVTGIPRPDLNRTFHGHPLGEGMVMPESFPGQGRELQRRVYGRLARFTSLETLMLGNEDRNFDNTSRYVESEMTIEEEDDEDHQYTCLEMSLSSGLQALGSLKKLRELRIMRMATAIGVEEVQWMVQSWPRLKKLSGLNYSAEASVQAASWMRERCPRIAVNMCKRGVTIE